MRRAGVALDGGVVGGGVAEAAGLAAVVKGRLEAGIGLEIGEEGWLLYATGFLWLGACVALYIRTPPVVMRQSCMYGYVFAAVRVAQNLIEV